MDSKQTGNPAPPPPPPRPLESTDQCTGYDVVVVVVGFQFVYYPFNYLVFVCASIFYGHDRYAALTFYFYTG